MPETGTTLAALLAADPTAARHVQPQQRGDAVPLGLNPHLSQTRRRELVELAGAREWADDLVALVAGQPGAPDYDLAGHAAAALTRVRTSAGSGWGAGRASLASLLMKFPAMLPRDFTNPNVMPSVPGVYRDFQRYSIGNALPRNEEGWQDYGAEELIELLSWTVDDESHPWHLPDGRVIDQLTDLAYVTPAPEFGRREGFRLLRRPAVREWVLAELDGDLRDTRLVPQLAAWALLSPYLPEDAGDRIRLLRHVGATVGVPATAVDSPLLSPDDLAITVEEEPTLGGQVADAERSACPDLLQASSTSTPSEVAHNLHAFPKNLRGEWAVAAEVGSPAVAAVLQYEQLGAVTRSVGVYAVEQMLDKHAAAHPAEADRHRRRMTDQDWAHPLRFTQDLTGMWAQDPTAAEELTLDTPVAELHRNVGLTARLPDEVTGLLDSHEAWERLAWVAEQYPDLTLGAALLLARDTAAVPA